MIIKVEVDLGWVDEDLSVSDTIQNRVVQQVSEKVLSMIDTQKQSAIAEIVSEKLDTEINSMLEGFLGRGFQPMDQWGDKKGDPVMVIDLLKSRLDNYFLEKVDSYGKKSEYNGSPRYKQILDKSAQGMIEDFQKQLSKDVLSGIKNDINAEARKRITDSILSDYDLKQLIK